jgi:phosphoenolpyruvate carboxylase
MPARRRSINAPRRAWPFRRSRNAVQLVPNRKHRRRHKQSAAYHRRVQKKWNKRFGMRAIPAAFMIGAQSGLLGNRATLIVHDEINEMMKRDLIAYPEAPATPSEPKEARTLQ